MSKTYLGNIELNQLLLGNDNIGNPILTPISSLFQVFPVSTVTSYFNALTTASFVTSSCTTGDMRIQKWVDTIDPSNFLTGSGAPITFYTNAYSCSAIPEFIGAADFGHSASVAINGSADAVSSNNFLQLTGSFSIFFTTNILSSGGGIKTYLEFISDAATNLINFNVDKDGINTTNYFQLQGLSGSLGVYPKFNVYSGSLANSSGWYGLTFNEPTKELKTYFNSPTPFLVTSSNTWHFPNLDLEFSNFGSPGESNLELNEINFLNIVPTEFEIEQFDTWTRTKYSYLY